MTSLPRRRAMVTWMLAPLAAGTLALSTEWALGHDPLANATVSMTSSQPAPSRSATDVVLWRQATRAARQLETARISLIRLEQTLRKRSVDLARLEGVVAGSRSRPVDRLPGLSAAPLPTSASAPAAMPAPAPAVSATTGAS